MWKERNLNYRNIDSKGNKAKRIGGGKRKQDTILREGVSLQCCFPFTGNRRRIWEAIRREWSFKRLCCWSSKEIQKCGGNKRGRWRKTSPLLFQSWNLCVVNISNRMTKTKKNKQDKLVFWVHQPRQNWKFVVKENGCKFCTNEKCTCEACKRTVLHWLNMHVQQDYFSLGLASGIVFFFRFGLRLFFNIQYSWRILPDLYCLYFSPRALLKLSVRGHLSKCQKMAVFQNHVIFQKLGVYRSRRFFA